LRGAAIVLHQELYVRLLEFRERHFGGILHRGRGDAGIALRRQRQDQADADLSGADLRRLHRLAGRRRFAAEAIECAAGTGGKKHGQRGGRGHPAKIASRCLKPVSLRCQ